MKISVKKYLLYSSVFAIFTEAFRYKLIIDWKLLYLILFVNFILLGYLKKIKINLYFLALLAFFFIHGAIAYTVIGITYNYMLSQIMGIAIVGTYYYNFVPLYDKKEIVDVYLKMSLYMAIIGYIFWIFKINLNDGIRLQSIMTEPAHYAIAVIPACYYYLKIKKYVPFLTIFGTLILSNSSLGFIGCGLIFLLPNLNLKRIGYLAMLVPILLLIFNYVYNEYSFFKTRVDDTYKSLNAINTGKFDEKTNLSSYILLANMFIAKENMTDHPLGSGIGSHHAMHQHYIKEMRVPTYIRVQDKENDNSFDACSLFTRISSEFGLIGIGLVLIALYYLSKTYLSNDLYFAQGIVIYVLLKLFRDGHYFPPEFYFFIWLLYFFMKEAYDKRKLAQSLEAT